MKGVIPGCLEKLVVEKFGRDQWKACLEAAGMPPRTSFLATQNIPDADVMKLVQASCKTLGITLQQAADAFGDYWVNDYASKIYRAYYRNSKNAREFLLNMDNVHEVVTKNVANAQPPRFTYEWSGDKVLIMHYKSNRRMIDFLVGLIKGVGRYFNEDLGVVKQGPSKVKVTFK